MERLLTQLVERGALDAADADWARARQSELGGPLDTALLELDLVDEADLLRALRERFDKPVASRDVLSELDRDLASRLPPGFAKSFSLCPLRFVGSELLTLVPSPIPPESRQELRELFGLSIRELIGPAHYVFMARAAVYGTVPDERNRELARRLARRQSAPDFVGVARRMDESRSISASMDDLLGLAGAYFEHACFLVQQGERLHVIQAGHRSKTTIARPSGGCTLAPALSFGGYFVGTVGGSDADRRFFEELGRPIPKKAFIAPAPQARGGRLVFYADNGPRGMPARWIAELSVLLGRLARGNGSVRRPRHAGRDAIFPGWHVPTLPSPTAPTTVSDAELRALRRLREAASRSGLELETFVERLLAPEAEPVKTNDSTSALVGEMKGLFERLATDIPAHLARGMEVAFRDLAPRLASGTPASATRARPTADVVLASTSAAPREVQSYASRRQKTARVKL